MSFTESSKQIISFTHVRHRQKVVHQIHSNLLHMHTDRVLRRILIINYIFEICTYLLGVMDNIIFFILTQL